MAVLPAAVPAESEAQTEGPGRIVRVVVAGVIVVRPVIGVGPVRGVGRMRPRDPNVAPAVHGAASPDHGSAAVHGGAAARNRSAASAAAPLGAGGWRGGKFGRREETQQE